MARHNLPRADDLHAIHIPFDPHRLERTKTRHAVAIAVESHRLILVHCARPVDARIHRVLGNSQSHRAILLEPLSDGLCLPMNAPLPLTKAAFPQIGVELIQVPHLRHWGCPPPLQVEHSVLNTRLPVPPSGHAEQGLECVVAGQGGVGLVHLTVATLENLAHHRLGVVPPDFSRHAPEELESRHHPRQHGFDPLRRRSLGESIIRVGPRHQEHRYPAPPLRQVHRNAPEVRFQPLTGIMAERNVCLPLALPAFLHIPTNGVVRALIPLLVPQPSVDLHRRVALFPWRLLVGREDLLDQRFEATQLRSGSRLAPRVGPRLGLLQGLTHFPARVVERPSDLTDAQTISVRSAYPAVVFYR